MFSEFCTAPQPEDLISAEEIINNVGNVRGTKRAQEQNVLLSLEIEQRIPSRSASFQPLQNQHLNDRFVVRCFACIVKYMSF